MKTGSIKSTEMKTKIRGPHPTPKKDMLYNNGMAKYDHYNKIWICTVCEYRNKKYNSKQITNHVKARSSSKSVIKATNLKHRNKGMRIEYANGRTLEMRNLYGGINKSRMRRIRRHMWKVSYMPYIWISGGSKSVSKFI